MGLFINSKIYKKKIVLINNLFLIHIAVCDLTRYYKATLREKLKVNTFNRRYLFKFSRCLIGFLLSFTHEW